MKVDTKFLEKCLAGLVYSFTELQEMESNSKTYNTYRSATIKEFEITLEQSAKLLKKVLQVYFSGNGEVDKLTFKGLFRSAGEHCLLSIDEVERWCNYRDSRNKTAHEYGFDLAEKIMPLLPQFIVDVERLVKVIGERNAAEG